MKSRSVAAMLVVLCVLATALVATSSALAAKSGAGAPKRSASSLLFVQVTKAGDLERAKPGVYRLVFDDVSPTVATFTDRPYRRAGEQGLSRFVHGWAGEGFAGDPPNAALVIHGAPSSHDVAMLTLSHPRYDSRARRLTYTVKPLHGSGAKSLAGFSRRGDPLRPLSFHDASLFIDDGGADAKVVPLTLHVTVSEFVQEEATLEISPGSSTVWSLGRPGARNSGLEVSSPTGDTPLSLLVVSPTEIDFRAGSVANGPSSFTLNLLVESEPEVNFVQIFAEISPGIQIEATADGVVTTWNPGVVLLPLFE